MQQHQNSHGVQQETLLFIEARSKHTLYMRQVRQTLQPIIIQLLGKVVLESIMP